MVLVGHSMGGLIARLQSLYSGNDVWRLVSEKRSPQALKADVDERTALTSGIFSSSRTRRSGGSLRLPLRIAARRYRTKRRNG